MIEPSPEVLKTAGDIRLAFFDIDGTLLDSQGKINPQLKPEIARIQALGIKTAIASGRPYFAAKFLTDELDINAAGMFYTGAHLFEPATQHSLLSVTLTQIEVQAVILAARQLGIYTEIYTEDAFYLEQVTEISRVHSYHLRAVPIIASLYEMAAKQVIYKLLIGVDRVAQGDLISQLEQQFPQLIFARAYLLAYPDWQFASVITGAASKQRAFTTLLDYHGVNARQVIAFGDAESDMDFLRMAGIGVAMGNAGDNVKAVADWVTKSVDDAGVAYALKYLLR